MKKYIKTSFFFIITIVFISCRPFSKESYLEKYDTFIKEISEKGASYSDKEWKKADEKFKKFNEDWYDHFKEDLSWQEKITTTKYNLQYAYYRNKTGALDFYNTYLKGDLEKLKEKIKYYKENNMQSDIDSLLKQAKEVGDTSLVIIQGLIKDVDKELNEKK